MRVECASGERRVNVAVEVRRWNVASSMNLGASGSRSGSGSGSVGLEGSRLGFLGGVSWGVGMSTEKFERARPRRGWWGMLPVWVLSVMLVLKPGFIKFMGNEDGEWQGKGTDRICIGRGARHLERVLLVFWGPKGLQRGCHGFYQVRQRRREL